MATETGRGQIVQLTKSDGSEKYYFPRTTFDAVFDSAGKDLKSTIALVNTLIQANSNAILTKIGLTDEIKFTVIQPSDPEHSYPTITSGETLDRILGKLQLWWSIINNKADGIPAGTSNDEVNTEGIAANKALRDATDGKRFVDKYALKADINKAVFPAGNVRSLSALNELFAEQKKAGAMYTILNGSSGVEDYFQPYYPTIDTEDNKVWTTGEPIYPKPDDDFVYIGVPDGWSIDDISENPDYRWCAEWQYVGGKIDTSSFALKVDTPYVTEVKEVDYVIDME